MAEPTLTREQYATQLIERVDHALQEDDWLVALDALDELKGVSPCLHNNVWRIIKPLFVSTSRYYGSCWD